MCVLIFQSTWKSDLKAVQITKMISFELMHLECAPHCKTQLQLKKITIANIWQSTPILTFDALSKWHEPDISQIFMPCFKNYIKFWIFLKNYNTKICNLPHCTLIGFFYQKLTEGMNSSWSFDFEPPEPVVGEETWLPKGRLVLLMPFKFNFGWFFFSWIGCKQHKFGFERQMIKGGDKKKKKEREKRHLLTN